MFHTNDARFTSKYANMMLISILEFLHSSKFCESNFIICRIIDKKIRTILIKKECNKTRLDVSYRKLYVIIVFLSFVHAYYRLKENESKCQLSILFFRERRFEIKK